MATIATRTFLVMTSAKRSKQQDGMQTFKPEWEAPASKFLFLFSWGLVLISRRQTNYWWQYAKRRDFKFRGFSKLTSLKMKS